MASQAEDLKMAKYSYLEKHPGMCFTPIAIEMSGVLGPLSMIFLRELGRSLSQPQLVNTISYSYLIQHLSVVVQRGNAASILRQLFSSPTTTDS